MARKHQAEQLLRQGFSPAQIAAEMGISVASVLGYLRTRIGEGSLKLSDLFFAIPKESRQMFEGALTERNGRKTVQWRKLPKGSYSRDELDLYLELKDASHFRGDLYQYIAEIETTLHELIRRVLILHHGQKEWWRIAIPVPIRTKCATRREEDDDPIDDNFVYTTLIELKEILNKNWRQFQNVLPKRWASRKQEFLSALGRLNGIRNAVMHPVKNRRWTEDDFDFVRDFIPGLHEFIDNYCRHREAINRE